MPARHGAALLHSRAGLAQMMPHAEGCFLQELKRSVTGTCSTGQMPGSISLSRKGTPVLSNTEKGAGAGLIVLQWLMAERKPTRETVFLSTVMKQQGNTHLSDVGL